MPTPDDIVQQDDAALPPDEAYPQQPIVTLPMGREAAKSTFADIMRQRQAAVDATRAQLDKTIEELRAKHTGAGFGQINVPLMAMAAGFLSPTASHSFGEEVSNALKGLVAGVQHQRMTDTDFEQKVADLQLKSGQLADAPFRDAAKMLQAADVAGIRSNRPLVNSQTGVTVFPNYFGTDKHGVLKAGAKDIVPLGDVATPAGAPAPGGTPAPSGGAPTEDDIKFLQQTVSPDIKPGTMVHDIKYDKLAKIAKEDPALAGDIWDILNYNQDVKSITAQRGSKIDARELYQKVRDIDPSFQPALFANVQKARQDWEGTGKQMQTQLQLQKTLNHMADALAAAGALHNGGNQLINAAGNKIAEWSGSAAPTNVQTVAAILSKEMAKYFAGSQGAGGVEERRDLEKMLSTARSPEQLQGAIRYAMSLVRGQAEPMAAMKTTAFGNRKKYQLEDLLDDSSKEAYKSIRENDITTESGRNALLKRLPPVTDAPKAWPKPSAAAIERLKKNPSERSIYEGAFGPGSSKSVLGE